MDYKWLYKIKYSDRKEYTNEYENRYNGVSTYKYGFKVGSSPAFVVINTEILQMVSRIQKLDKELLRLETVLPRLALDQYYQKCLIDEVQQTNELEGIASTRKEIKNILVKKEDNSRLLGIIQKYQLLGTNDTIPLNNCTDIRELYNDLVLEEVKESNPDNVPDGDIFRKDNVYVKDKASGEVIHKGLYPETSIIQSMTSLLSILDNPTYNMLINISVIHYMFGYIHPFYDGNGRMSRFISSYLLSKELEHIIGYRLAYTIKKDTRKYYKMFKLTNEDVNMGDLTPFTIYFLELIETSLSDLTRYFKDQSAKLDFYHSKILSSNMSEDNKDLAFILVQNTLFAFEGLSVNELSAIYKKSSSKIRTMITELDSIGILNILKKRPYLYNANLDKINELF